MITVKILKVKITKSRSHDSKEFYNLLSSFAENISKVLADKGYDSERNFRFCSINKIVVGIHMKIDSTMQRRGKRRNSVAEQFGLSIGNDSHDRFFISNRLLKQKE
jgi:DNA gyrase/topoisomerase IV subunit A